MNALGVQTELDGNPPRDILDGSNLERICLWSTNDGLEMIGALLLQALGGFFPEG